MASTEEAAPAPPAASPGEEAAPATPAEPGAGAVLHTQAIHLNHLCHPDQHSYLDPRLDHRHHLDHLNSLHLLLAL